MFKPELGFQLENIEERIEETLNQLDGKMPYHHFMNMAHYDRIEAIQKTILHYRRKQKESGFIDQTRFIAKLENLQHYTFLLRFTELEEDIRQLDRERI